MNLSELSQKLEDHLTDQDIQDAQELLDETCQQIVDMQAEIDALKAANSKPKRKGMLLDQPIMYVAEVAEATSKPCPTIYRESREGTFPKPIQLGKRRQAWLRSDVSEWIDQRLKERFGGAKP